MLIVMMEMAAHLPVALVELVFESDPHQAKVQQRYERDETVNPKLEHRC